MLDLKKFTVTGNGGITTGVTIAYNAASGNTTQLPFETAHSQISATEL